MTYEEWIRGTNTGLLAIRSKELVAVDKAFLAYTRATTPYGKEWEAREARIALEQWKAKQPNWRASDRNRHRTVDRLDLLLPRPTLMGNGYGGEGEVITSLRYGTLYFLANARTSALPTDLMGFLNDGTDTSSDLHTFIDTSSASGWRFQNGSYYDPENKKNGFLESVSEVLIEYINELAAFVHASSWVVPAAEWIVKQLPQLLMAVLAGLASKLTAVLEVASGLRTAARAAVGNWKARQVEAGVLSGQPRVVIQSIREQIKESGYDGLKSAFKAGALAALTMIPGAGTVVGAVASALASLWAFVTKVMDHFADYYVLNGIFVEARNKMWQGLHNRPLVFNRWFKNICKEMPLISSYCMAMPLTGSYYGFLTLIGTDGQEMSYRQLERNYAMFNDVKKWAKGFVRGHSIKLSSRVALVQRSIELARGEHQQWDNSKSGVKTRVKKLAIGVIETAVGDVARRG